MSAKKPPQARPTRLKAEAGEADLRQIALKFGGANAQTSKRGNGKASSALVQVDDPRVIELKGRILATGERVGMGVKRRMTIYLPLDVAEAIELEKVRSRKDFGDLIAEAWAARVGNPLPARAASVQSSSAKKRPTKKNAAKKPVRKRRAA